MIASFPRLLAAAAGGAALAYAFLPHVRHGIMPYPWVFLGAAVGARLAVGKGGTARIAALAGSALSWVLGGLVLFRAGGLALPASSLGAWDLVHLGCLLGGWAAVVASSMERLDGRVPVMGRLALGCVGLLVGRVLAVLALAGWTLLDGLDGLVPPALTSAAWLTASALMGTLGMTCALGAMASLAGRLDLSWAWAVSTAVVLAFAREGLLLVFERASGRMSIGLELGQILLLEMAWCAWWAHRLTRPTPEG